MEKAILKCIFSIFITKESHVSAIHFRQHNGLIGTKAGTLLHTHHTTFDGTQSHNPFVRV